MKSPLISIVIPVYNSEEYIYQCLDSVVKQEEKCFEVIVVDDGSKDKSPVIIDEFAEKNDNIIAIHQPNGGVINARKNGTKNANGKYVLNLDSDDWILPDHIGRIKNEIEKNNPDIVFTGYTEFNNGITTTRYQNIACGFYDSKGIQECIIDKFISTGHFFTFGIYPTLWTSCIKKELIVDAQQNLPETYSIGDDISVTCPCILNAKSISIIDATSYLYRIQNSSMTHVFDIRFSEKLLCLLNYLTSVLPNWIIQSNQFKDYVIFEVCLMVSAYLGHGVQEHGYSDMLKKIMNALDNPLIMSSINEFDLKRSNIPIKWKIKIFLIKRRWFGVYKLLAK